MIKRLQVTLTYEFDAPEEIEGGLDSETTEQIARQMKDMIIDTLRVGESYAPISATYQIK